MGSNNLVSLVWYSFSSVTSKNGNETICLPPCTIIPGNVDNDYLTSRVYASMQCGLAWQEIQSDIKFDDDSSGIGLIVKDLPPYYHIQQSRHIQVEVCEWFLTLYAKETLVSHQLLSEKHTRAM